MLGLLRQPLIKSVKIAQFGGKNVAQPIPRVLQRSYGRSIHHGEKTSWLKPIFFWGGFVVVTKITHDCIYAFLEDQFGSGQKSE
ncbi:hypothetical protein HCN44_006818 [Aphidius gifuensis]|uniref:Uncharacterized protein n=1 Tax=Aphidius gifuensis TaxID=684658 RepID=A0A834XZG5_APHGI|nr:hypothetical protein HCN44_006818 [Aphidius gifuensis]